MINYSRAATDFLNGIRLLSVLLIPVIVALWLWFAVKWAMLYDAPMFLLTVVALTIIPLVVLIGMGKVWARFLE